MNIKCDTEYMLKCLIVKEDQSILQLNKIEADVICKEKDGMINFVHLTYDDCIDSILKDGFRTGDGLLGIGVYVVNPSDKKSLNSLVNFYTDLSEGCDSMIVVQGRYKGKYRECVYALNENYKYSEGFILLEDVSNIEITKYTDVPVSCIERTLKELGA